jgi:cell division protein FtsB
MKKNLIVFIAIVGLLLLYGVIYLFTVRLQTKLSALNNEYDSLTLQNETLREQTFYYSSLDRIEEIARKKFGMSEPKNFYIVELNDEK